MSTAGSQIFWGDGLDSRVVSQALQSTLGEMRRGAGGGRAVALYRPWRSSPGCFVLSDSHDGAGGALSNEPVRLNQPTPLPAPVSLTGVIAASTVRPTYRIELDAAVGLPWEDAYGCGNVLIGVEDERDAKRALNSLWQGDLGQFVSRLTDARLRGTLELHRRLNDALLAVLLADIQILKGTGRPACLLRAARALFGADLAYLNLPRTETGTHYTFVSVTATEAGGSAPESNRTGAVGERARADDRVVNRVVDLLEGPSAMAAPGETAEDGICCALAISFPVHKGTGILYVGRRSMSPFGAADEHLLQEFAEAVSRALRVSTSQVERTEHLWPDLPEVIHDRVVRSLLQIGYTAEQAVGPAHEDSVVQAISSIRTAADAALRDARRHLNALDLPTITAATTVDQVVDRLDAQPLPRGTRRSVEVRDFAVETTLPGTLTDVLTRVGTKAMTNSLRYARFMVQTIRVDISRSEVELTVSDDGTGGLELGSEPTELARMGHLGLASAHRWAASVGGRLRIVSSPEKGTSVTVRVPRP